MKYKHSTLNRYTISSLALAVVVAAACSVVILRHNTTDAAPKPATKTTVVSDFSFTGTAGWWRGATNKTSMALFHRASDGCFVSAEYHTGTVNVAAELQQNEKSLTSTGYTLTPTGTQALTLQTATSPRQYQLQQYSVTGAGTTGQIMGGQEFGYVQLPAGYIKLMGYCDTSSQLTATIPALQAFKFDER